MATSIPVRVALDAVSLRIEVLQRAMSRSEPDDRALPRKITNDIKPYVEGLLTHLDEEPFRLGSKGNVKVIWECRSSLLNAFGRAEASALEEQVDAFAASLSDMRIVILLLSHELGDQKFYLQTRRKHFSIFESGDESKIGNAVLRSMEDLFQKQPKTKRAMADGFRSVVKEARLGIHVGAIDTWRTFFRPLRNLAIIFGLVREPELRDYPISRDHAGQIK